jgi:hypothetical protein
MKLYRTLDDLKRTADANTQYDSALSLASSKEKEVAAKTETMKALHKNLGVLILSYFSLLTSHAAALHYTALQCDSLCNTILCFVLLSYPILSNPITSH